MRKRAMKVNPMTAANPKPEGKHDHPDGTFDRALDAALVQYSAVESRSGLEERILANLRAEQVHATGGPWWQWSLAAALATVVVMSVALGWRTGRKPLPLTSNHPVQTPEKTNSATPVRSPELKFMRRYEAVRLAETHVAPPRKVLAANPKLDQFPSQQPLSAEEIALTQYVRNFPQEAQLVAQAQEEFELETEKEMNDGGSETWPSASIQSER